MSRHASSHKAAIRAAVRATVLASHCEEMFAMLRANAPSGPPEVQQMVDRIDRELRDELAEADGECARRVNEGNGSESE